MFFFTRSENSKEILQWRFDDDGQIVDTPQADDSGIVDSKRESGSTSDWPGDPQTRPLVGVGVTNPWQG